MMQRTRDDDLQDVIGHCRVLMAPASPELDGFLDRVFASLDATGPANPDHGANQVPVCETLPAALQRTADASAGLAELAGSFERLAPRLNWYTRPGAEKVGTGFANGHANAVLIGEGGLELHDDVRIGVSLVAPDVEYIEHRHPPEEAYLVMSGGEWRQNRGEWFARQPGQMVHNAPGILHAMRAGAVPLLAIWLLWTAV